MERLGQLNVPLDAALIRPQSRLHNESPKTEAQMTEATQTPDFPPAGQKWRVSTAHSMGYDKADRTHDVIVRRDPDGTYYAKQDEWGCGRCYSTPKAAIDGLARSNWRRVTASELIGDVEY
jgi:hypothetical protein